MNAVLVEMDVDHHLRLGNGAVALGAVDAVEAAHLQAGTLERGQDLAATVIDAAVEQHVGRLLRHRRDVLHLMHEADADAVHERIAGQLPELGDVALAVVPHGEALHQIGIDRSGLQLVAAQLLEIDQHRVGRQRIGDGAGIDQVGAEDDVHAFARNLVAQHLAGDAELGQGVAEGANELGQCRHVRIAVRLDQDELHLLPGVGHLPALRGGAAGLHRRWRVERDGPVVSSAGIGCGAASLSRLRRPA